jgi:CRISPR/Cas system-associated protein Csm6
MTVIFATVGTSALYNRDIGKGWPKEALLKKQIVRYQEDPEKNPEEWKDLFKDLVTVHAEVLQAAWDKKDHFRTSAELTSTMYLLGGKVEAANVAKIVYLASATRESEMAARVNEAVAKRRWPKLTIARDRIEGLEAHFIDVRDAIAKVVGKHVLQGHDVVFNITGGFKGAIPSIADLAREKGWKLFYQHESCEFGVESTYPTPSGPIHERLLPIATL